MQWFIDIPLLLLLAGYLLNGLRRGFARSLGAIVGVVAGGIAAFYLVPLVGGFVPDAFWRFLASIGIAIGLLILGHGLGSSIGNAIAKQFPDGPLRVIDRILGAAVNVVLAALVISLLAASVAPLGVPLLSQAVGQSTVISTIDRLTPEPVQSFVARARSIAVTDTIPSIVGVFGGETEATATPDAETQTDVLREAAASVVKITGNAFECGQSQSGTGFVIAGDRIVTNAHVVAGVSEPVVDVPGGDVLPGRIVYFDPIDDLAVIAVSGLEAATLDLSPVLAVGDDAVFDGYPFGGPFTTGPATVMAVGSQQVDDIYSDTSTARDIYTLAASIQEGDSGGPLLATDGTVAGVVFARSAASDTIGYAMTVDELAPVVTAARTLTDRVDTGACISG